MELIETAKRIAEIDDLIKKETLIVTPTFNNKDSFSPNVKATVTKTLKELKKPEIKYDLPDETPYTNIHTQFDFIVKGSNSQFRMFEIRTTENQFDIDGNYITYLNRANVFRTNAGESRIDDTLLTPFVMKNIKMIDNLINEINSPKPNLTTYTDSRKTLYDSLVELVVEENKKADEDEATALAAAVVGGQKGGGFNVDEVLKFETLLDITPEQIEEDMYTSSVFYTLTTTSFPKIVDSASIFGQDINVLTQQLECIDGFFQTLVTIEKKKDLLTKIQKCFSREIGIINTNLAKLKPADFEKISQAYVTALSYLKTQKELKDISSTMIIRDKEQEDKIIREEIVKKATEALDGIFLIQVDTFDTPFVGPNSRNIKIVIPAKQHKHTSNWYNAISDGASYTDLSVLPNFKKCKKLIACDFYKDNKIKDIYVTCYDTTFITFKLKEVRPINGEIYLQGDDNKSYDIKKCYFTTTEIKKNFGISLDDQYMVGFFFGKLPGNENYLPGYYVKEKYYFLNEPTKLYSASVEFKDMTKELITLLQCELSYDTDDGIVTDVESLDNVITTIIFNNSKKKIEEVFATGAQLQKIYANFGLKSERKLVFIQGDVSRIIQKPELYRNTVVYAPGVQNKNTSVPLYDPTPYTSIPKENFYNTPLPVDKDLTSNDYKITFIKEDGGIKYETGQLIRVSKNVEKFTFTILTDDVKEYNIDQCFFTKYQWEKILGNSYIDYEGFFIGWADPNKFSSITDKKTPLYLPGYYFTNEKNQKFCKFFIDVISDVVANKTYVSNFPEILLETGNVLSYDNSEEEITGVLTNDDGTIKEIKFATGDISIDKIFVQQHQILNFYPTLWNLSLFFNSIFAPQVFCERKIIIYKISQMSGIKFSIILKKDMEFDILIFGKQTTITNIAEENGKLHQITKIFIDYDPSDDKSSFILINPDPPTGTRDEYDILKIYLYESEMNKLINAQKNSNGLIGFSLEKNTNLEGQNCDVITNAPPNSFFPGYQLDNTFKLLCNSDVIPTMVNNSCVNNFIGKEISFLNLAGTEEDGIIANYICNEKDEIIGVMVAERVINIERCFVKNTQIQEYYDDYNLTFEEYLNKYEILLCRVNNTQTSFNSTRPIWIYTFFKREKYSRDVYGFVRLNPLGYHGNEIVFIDSDTNINSLDQDFQLYNSNTSTTTKLSSINYFISDAIPDGTILFNDKITLDNVFIYSYQLSNTYGVGFMNAEINFKLFMINSETITEYKDIINKYTVQDNELLFLYGYFHGNGPISNGCTIELLMDNPPATKATSKTIDYMKDYNFFSNINIPDKIIPVSDYIQSKDMMSEVVYTDGVRQQISIKKCFKIFTDGIVINHTPLKIINPDNLRTFLTDDTSIMANILNLSNNELNELDNLIITVITDFITKLQLNDLDNDKIVLLYTKTDNKQELTDKLNPIKAVEIFNVDDGTGNKSVTPTVKDIQNLKDNILDNLDLLPTNFAEKNSIIDGFSDAQIDSLIDPSNRRKLDKLAVMTPDEINANLENMSAKYLKLLVQQKINTGEEAAFVAAIDKKLTTEQINSLKILQAANYDALNDKIHLNELSLEEKLNYLKDMHDNNELKNALISITNKLDVTKLLNDELIIKKLTPRKILEILNSLKHYHILYLNNRALRDIIRKDDRITRANITPNSLANFILALDVNRLNDKLAEKNAVDQGYVQNFANDLTNEKIKKLSADKIQVLRNQIRDIKLFELFNKLDKAQLKGLKSSQINKLLETANFYNIFKGKLTPSEIIKLNNPALITQLMADATENKQTLANKIIQLNNPALITQLMADATVNKQDLVDSLKDISNLDVASIEALEATLDSHQCLEIFDKIDKSKLTPEKLNAFTKGLEATPWHNVITELDDDVVTALIRTMNAAEIERRNDELEALDGEKWLDIFKKINDNEIITFDANKINAISKNGHWSGKELIDELTKPGVIDGMAPEQKLAIKTLLGDKQEILKTLGAVNLKKLGFTQPNYLNSDWKGGIKTKRSKVKKNKTRRL